MIRFTRNFSTLQASLLRRRTAADLAVRISDAEREVATGRKADVYKTLGLSAAKVLDLRATIDRTDGFITGNTQLQNRLDTMADTLSGIRKTAESVLALAIANRDRPTLTAVELQMAARAALDSITGRLNTSYQGAALFGGIETDKLALQTWDAASVGTGLSPHQVMDDILAGGIGNAADAAAKAAEVAAAFGNASGTAARNFDATFYNGAPQSAPRLSARIDETTTLDYGIQANDPAYAGILQGLAMLAATDVSQIADEAAYGEWVRVAVDALSRGATSALDAEATLGTRQGRLKDVIEGQKARQDIYKSQVVGLEGADPYEAASRISLLESQLQASYAVTARLSNLSFLNFMK
jgi:flagellar hook-associated protein 3 FlgL